MYVLFGRSLCAFPFTFPKVYLHLKTADCKFEVESHLVNVVLYKNEVQKVHIEFMAKMEDIDKDIQVSCVPVIECCAHNPRPPYYPLISSTFLQHVWINTKFITDFSLVIDIY